MRRITTDNGVMQASKQHEACRRAQGGAARVGSAAPTGKMVFCTLFCLAVRLREQEMRH